MSGNDIVLVTGAMGQLGKRVVKILLNRGRTVITLDLSNDKTLSIAEELKPAHNQPGKLVPVFFNLLDEAAVQSLFSEYCPTVVVHLAASIAPHCYLNPKSAYRVNVDGTRILVEAAKSLVQPPLFLEASSSSVYGSRNPYRDMGRLTANTPVNPIDCYGADKVEAERILVSSNLPYAILRLGAIISPDAMSNLSLEQLLLIRAIPRDNRVHAVDARDAALAFANATERGTAIDGKILLIGGNESYVMLQRQMEDDAMQAVGLGRLGPWASLPGDPTDDMGWGLTDWFDTLEAQRLLDFQGHYWNETIEWITDSQGWSRLAIRAASPVLRLLILAYLAGQRLWERRGKYANPWPLISKKFGEHIFVQSK